MRIGVFGGTFDPPHFGHISLVCSMIEKLQLDRVYIIPSQINPLKQTTKTKSDIRLKMTKLAFQDIPKTTVLDCELKRSGLSYTVDTLHWLMDNDKEFRQATRFLLVGDDLVPDLGSWKSPDELFSLAQLVVARRGVDEVFSTYTIQKIDSPIIDISSTEIRERLKKRLYCGHLVPHATLALIEELHVYTNAEENLPGNS